MNNLTFEDFISLVEKYNKEEVEIVTRAYNRAKELHEGQFRDSGEDYIIHPLNVAYMLAQTYADRDTLCAGLLHDTLEDTKITKEELASEFNEDIANFVDAVSKVKELECASEEEADVATYIKLMNSMFMDVRPFLIKLDDNLHNLRTLEFKKREKQIEKANITLKFYVPIAERLGGYKIKRESEDLAFQYLNPESFQFLTEYKKHVYEINKDFLLEVISIIKEALKQKGINCTIEIREKNIYDIYKRLERGYKLEEIQDLLALKIIVNSIDDCYLAMRVINNLYVPYKVTDYIGCPKPNKYQSLHTTFFVGNQLLKGLIRTPDMDLTAEYGIMAYWYTKKGEAKKAMNDDLKNLQFIKVLAEINSKNYGNIDFINQAESKILTDMIYVYNTYGDYIELKKGSTIIDYLRKLRIDFDSKPEVYVNNHIEPVSYNYVLNNRDIINIVMEKTDDIAIDENSYIRKMILK